jgi:hypothetical protein
MSLHSPAGVDNHSRARGPCCPPAAMQQGGGGARGTAQLLGNPLSAPKQARRQSGEVHSPARKGQGGQAESGPNHKGKGRRGGGQARGGHTQGQVLPTLPCPPGWRHTTQRPVHQRHLTHRGLLTRCQPRRQYSRAHGGGEGMEGTQRSAKCGSRRAGATTARRSSSASTKEGGVTRHANHTMEGHKTDATTRERGHRVSYRRTSHRPQAPQQQDTGRGVYSVSRGECAGKLVPHCTPLEPPPLTTAFHSGG